MTGSTIVRNRTDPAGKARPDPEIKVRNRRFGRGEVRRRWWLGDDPFASAFFNSLSISFPHGEAYFIESVRACRDSACPQLAESIRSFCAQEVNHSREHVAFNRGMVEAGYEIAHLEAAVIAILDMARQRPAIANLAATMALEHFTAIIAHVLLIDDDLLARADPQTAAIWRWHAAEEIEHKAVAYDTWLAATADWPRRKRWTVKTLMMMLVARNFLRLRYMGAIDLLRQDGITGWRAHLGLLRYALLSPGIVTRIVPHWLAYFLPGFHPWNRDDRALIANTAEAAES